MKNEDSSSHEHSGEVKDLFQSDALPFNFTVVRSRRKTLSLCVDRFGGVTVRAPLYASTKKIIVFLREKSDWVAEKLLAFQIENERIPNAVADGAVFPLFGEDTEIRLIPADRFAFLFGKDGGASGKNAALCGNCLYLPDDFPERRLIAFLKSTAKAYLSKEAERLAEEMGTAYSSLSVNGAKTRWGSCTYRNGLNFSYRLIYAEKSVIEYVVTHELAHTFEKNHSARFWAIVAKYQPRYKEMRAYLKKRAYYMQIF